MPVRLLIAAGGTLLSLLGLWATAIPLGIPGEWTWERLPYEPGQELGWAWLVVLGAAYVAGAVFGAEWATATSRWMRWGAVLGLVAAGGVWSWQVQHWGPTFQQWGKAPFVLYFPSSSGYFYKVRYESPDIRRFLAGYEALMAEGDVLHVGTHPPGLFVVFYGLIAAADALPASWLDTQPADVQEAFEIVQGNTRHLPVEQQLTANDRKCLWLTMVLLAVWNALAVVPIYVVGAQLGDRRGGWCAAALWGLVPAGSIFFPKSDVAFAGAGAALLAMWLHGVGQRRTGWGLLAAAWAAVCLCFSLAFLPWCLVLALITPLQLEGTWRERAWGTLRWAALAGGGFAAVVVGLSVCGGVWLPRVWWWNYHNHAGFYEQFSRSYGAWLVLNPLEAGLALGVPATVLALHELWRRLGQQGEIRSWAWYVPLAVWLVLWLTGKNSGEAARLWCPLIPWALWWAGAGLAQFEQRRWLVLAMGLQVLACVGTVHRVGGFGMWTALQ